MLFCVVAAPVTALSLHSSRLCNDCRPPKRIMAPQGRDKPLVHRVCPASAQGREQALDMCLLNEYLGIRKGVEKVSPKGCQCLHYPCLGIERIQQYTKSLARVGPVSHAHPTHTDPLYAGTPHPHMSQIHIWPTCTMQMPPHTPYTLPPYKHTIYTYYIYFSTLHTRTIHTCQTRLPSHHTYATDTHTYYHTCHTYLPTHHRAYMSYTYLQHTTYYTQTAYIHTTHTRTSTLNM